MAAISMASVLIPPVVFTLLGGVHAQLADTFNHSAQISMGTARRTIILWYTSFPRQAPASMMTATLRLESIATVR